MKNSVVASALRFITTESADIKSLQKDASSRKGKANWNVLLLLFFTLGFSSCSDSTARWDLIPVKSGKVYGYVNPDGRYVINPQFDNATYFRGDLALVKKDGKYGYINKKGNFEINPIYESATPFSEGVAITVQNEGAPTVINTSGNVMFTLKQARRMHAFYDGRAMYSTVKHVGNWLYGYVDKNGKTVIQPIFEDARSFSEGLAAVTNKDGKWGYINDEGKLVVNYQFSTAGYFHGGRAIVSNEGKVGVIDTKGKYIINPQFSMMLMDGDRYVICLAGGGDFGWCDAKGKILINPQFSRVTPFLNGDLTAVTGSNGSVGYIDKDGRYVINPQFKWGIPFIEKRFAIVQSGDKFGFIDKEGHYIVNPQFDNVSLDVFDDLRMEDLESSYYCVLSDYFDIDAIVEKVRKMIEGDKIDGLTLKTPLNTIMQKYGKKDEQISPYLSNYTLTGDVKWSEDVSFNLFMKGHFHKEVSDGWWGTTKVLVKSATPSAYILQIKLSGKGEGKQENLYKAVLKGFGAKYDGSDMLIGRVGNLRLTFEKTYDGMKIIVDNKSNSNNEKVVLEAQPGEKIYKGTINDKYGIVMKLSINGKDITGSYYYTSKRKEILLSGTLDGNSISLTETSDGRETGRFIGTLTDDEVSGTWMNMDNSKTMPFLAIKDSNV